MERDHTPYSHKRSIEAEKRRQDLKTQKQVSRRFIYANEFKDQIKKETVNLVTQSMIVANLDKQFDGGHLLAAVPSVERAEVLEIPNLYHLELFPNCNEFSQ